MIHKTMTVADFAHVVTREVEYARAVLARFPDEASVRTFAEAKAGREYLIDEVAERVLIVP
jgi:hypothetical protein